MLETELFWFTLAARQLHSYQHHCRGFPPQWDPGSRAGGGTSEAGREFSIGNLELPFFSQAEGTERRAQISIVLKEPVPWDSLGWDLFLLSFKLSV